MKAENKIFALKITFIVTLTLGLLMIIIQYNKKEHKTVRYIGNSILETPNIMPENCSVERMEYYEHLVSTK